MPVTDTTESTVPWRSRTVQAVLLSTALAPLGVPLVSPALPVVRDTFGLTDSQASLLVSAYFVAGIALSPFIGLLIDRFGRKRTLVAGLSTFGLLGGAMAFAPSFEVVLALRVLQGTGAAAIFITTVTLLSERFEGTQRNAVLGANVAVLSTTAALFPVLGGYLATVAWNAPFVAYFAAIPVAAFVATVVEESPGSGPDSREWRLLDSLRTVATPATLALFGVTFLTEFLGFGVVFTAVPFLLARTWTPVLIGAALLGAEAASALVAAASGKVGRALSNLQIISLGFACYGLGFLGSWSAPDPVFVAVALVVVGAGIGLLLPAVDAALSNRVTTENRAETFSLRNSTTFLGRTTGPVVFTGLAVTVGVGYVPLLLAAGVVALTAALLVLLASA